MSSPPSPSGSAADYIRESEWSVKFSVNNMDNDSLRAGFEFSATFSPVDSQLNTPIKMFLYPLCSILSDGF